LQAAPGNFCRRFGPQLPDLSWERHLAGLLPEPGRTPEKPMPYLVMALIVLIVVDTLVVALPQRAP